MNLDAEIQWIPPVYDYNERDLVGREGCIVEYIRALVREVLDKARQHGIHSFAWCFEMHPKTWQRLTEVYACSAPSGAVSVPILVVEQGLADLRERMALPVDGRWYDVRVYPDMSQSDILFVCSEAPLIKGVVEKLPVDEDDHES